MSACAEYAQEQWELELEDLDQPEPTREDMEGAAQVVQNMHFLPSGPETTFTRTTSSDSRPCADSQGTRARRTASGDEPRVRRALFFSVPILVEMPYATH